MPLPTHNVRPSAHFHPGAAHQTSSHSPCRKHSLMCLYFHSNSRLLSSASTSHVYESVHLPGGLRTSPVHPPPPPPPRAPHTSLALTPTLLPASFNRHFLKCQLPTGPKKDRQWETQAQDTSAAQSWHKGQIIESSSRGCGHGHICMHACVCMCKCSVFILTVHIMILIFPAEWKCIIYIPPWQRSSIVAPLLLIPFFPPHRLLTLRLLFYPCTSSSLRHTNCLRHSVLSFSYCVWRSATVPVVYQSLPSFYLVLIPSQPSSQFTHSLSLFFYNI